MVNTNELRTYQQWIGCLDYLSKKKVNIYYYTDVKQVVALHSGNSVSKDVDRDPLAYAQELFRKNRGSTFVLGDARRISDENAFSREILDSLYLAMETAGTIVLVTPDYVCIEGREFIIALPESFVEYKADDQF